MLWLLPLPPFVAASVVLMAPLRSRAWLATVSCIALAATLALALWANADHWTGAIAWSTALRLQVLLTPLSAAVAVTVPLVALPVLAYAAAVEEAVGLPRLVALQLVFVGAMELLVIADDLLTLLIGWEVVGACSWALIGHAWRDAENPASATYAFVMTRFGDLGLFIAAMATFTATGSFAYADLAKLDGWPLQIVVGGLLLSAASKSGQLPFSPWLFRAMAGPTAVSALLHAATMVAAGAYVLARLQPALDRVAWFAPVVIAIGLATALVGGVVAIVQRHAKKLLAASTSAHFGLMFVAVGAGHPEVAILHLMVHGFFKALLFLSVGIAGHRVLDYSLVAMRLEPAMPFVASASAVAALSLAGVPPFAGGWTKDEVVAAASQFHPWIAGGVIVAGGLSAAYAARLQLLAFGKRYGFSDERASSVSWILRASLGVLALATLTSSLLWSEQGRSFAAGVLSAPLPEATTWQFGASLLAVALGLATGRILAVRHPLLGEGVATRLVSDWFQLPALWRRAAIEPSFALARVLARFDDVVVDGTFVQGASWVARRASRGLARGDQAVVDRGIEATARACDRLAAVASRTGEWLADGLPEGLARLTELGGEDARSLQTGLSHHYYVIVALGALAVFATLWMGT